MAVDCLPLPLEHHDICVDVCIIGAAQIAHHSRRPKRPVRFLITAAGSRGGGGVWNVAHMIAPHAPQYSSLFVLSLCILHLPHAGHGGKPFSLALTRGPLRGFFLSGLNQPFLGRFTLGTASPCDPERVLLMRLPRDGNMLADAIMSGAAIASHALHSGRGRRVWALMCS